MCHPERVSGSRYSVSRTGWYSDENSVGLLWHMSYRTRYTAFVSSLKRGLYIDAASPRSRVTMERSFVPLLLRVTRSWLCRGFLSEWENEISDTPSVLALSSVRRSQYLSHGKIRDPWAESGVHEYGLMYHSFLDFRNFRPCGVPLYSAPTNHCVPVRGSSAPVLSMLFAGVFLSYTSHVLQ